MKTLLKTVALLVIALSLSGCLAGKYMCNYALLPEPHGVADIERTQHKGVSRSRIQANSAMNSATAAGNAKVPIRKYSSVCEP